MQTYLSLIQTMLSEWYLFTLKNPLYAAVLATSVWLLTAILYSIRIAALKRANTNSEKTAVETTTALQKQLQESQEEVAAVSVVMEKATSAVQDETQRALTLEQLIYQRNKQIAEIIQLLATSFDLGERPLLATEDVKADSLWQQHTKVINQLIERLRSEQQAKKELQQTCQEETAKLAEKEVLLEALQSTMDIHATQLSKLELALEEQKTILQQQDKAQQILSDTLKNQQTAVVVPAQPQQETIKPFIQTEAKSNVVDTPITVTAPPSQPVTVPTNEPVKPVEAIVPVQPFIKPKAPVDKAPYVSLDIEQQPVIAAKEGSFGKIKNLFGTKQAPVKTEPQWTAPQPTEPEVPALKTEPLPEEVAPKASGKLQGLYSKFRSKGK